MLVKHLAKHHGLRQKGIREAFGEECREQDRSMGWQCANRKGATAAEKISGIKLRGFGNFLNVANWFII